MRRTALEMLALMLLFYGAYYYPYPPDSAPARLIATYVGLQAHAAAALIETFDASARLHGNVVSGAFALEVIKDCSSLDAQALLAAAVIGFPARRRAKLLGLGMGLLLLNLANIARIAGLYAVGARAPSVFDSVHEELMPLALVALACAFFAVWAARASLAPPRQRA
ncbi:MAG: exosortase H [Polyangiales bacterium]